MNNFSIARLPAIEFGRGAVAKLPGIIKAFGNKALIVTGKQSFIDTKHWLKLQKNLQNHHIHHELFTVATEPSPEMADEAAAKFRSYNPDVVVGIGGGSALDAAKAIAGLIRQDNSVMDYLEGVGPELPYQGPAVPLVEVPTTAGTGSEATKNAVLSRIGDGGFKKSFRHETLVPAYAVLDPDLLKSCPPGLIAANGMDAFTQLLESFVSLKANPFTDALALDGMRRVNNSLLHWHQNPEDSDSERADMAYAALLSGITLAQCGLGSVHGLASPLGAFFPVPHGVVCGTLVATATKINIQAMQEREPENTALDKYAKAGNLLAGRHGTQTEGLARLTEILDDWTEKLQLPRLSSFGIKEEDTERIVQNSRGSSMKTNPVLLTDAEIALLIKARL